jgi:hypothetical protein
MKSPIIRRKSLDKARKIAAKCMTQARKDLRFLIFLIEEVPFRHVLHFAGAQLNEKVDIKVRWKL